MATVRPAEISDMEAVAAIYAHHVLYSTASFEVDAPSVEEMSRRRADVIALGFPYLVAGDLGEVVGVAYVRPFHARPAYRDTVENAVYIRSDLLGRGLGKLLLRALIRNCEKI